MWLSMLLQLILQPKPEETVVNTIGIFLCRHQILVHQLANGRLHRTCRGQAVFLDERHRLRLFGLAFGGNGFQYRALPFAQPVIHGFKDILIIGDSLYQRLINYGW